MQKPIIVVAGGTGNLGGKIVTALLEKGAEVRVIVRPTSNAVTVNNLIRAGAKVFPTDLSNLAEVSAICKGASCVVSALAGLEEVILVAQKELVNAAIKAGVPRFIPSDYSLDFTKFNDGENRNLDFRREFHRFLDAAPIESTSIFNGAFMEMLTNEIPMIIFNKKLILFWGNSDHKMGFTTVQDTATFTANVALEKSSPRYLRVAGDQISPKEIQKVMLDLTGKNFRLIRTGGLGLFSFIIGITKRLAPGKDELYPAWQGMQYMRNMIDDRANLQETDNQRFPSMKWTTVKMLLAGYLDKK